LSPGAWLIGERLKRARDLLEDTTLSIDAVAREVGFGGAINLRKHFRRTLGLSPAIYRARFDASA
jgi:AraC family transcriptional activator FtrA